MKKILYPTFILIVGVFSCREKSPEPLSSLKTNTTYIIGSGYTNQPGGFLTSYPTLPSGNFDNSNSDYALQLSNFSARAHKNRLYGATPDFPGMTKYKINEQGQISKEAEMALTDGFNRIAFVSDHEAWFTRSGDLNIYQFNPSTMSVGITLSLKDMLVKILPQIQNLSYQSTRDIFYRDNKLYVTLDFGTLEYLPKFDSVFVAVVDVPSQKFVGVSAKAGTRLAGDVYPYYNALFEDEKGDIYMLCLGKYGNTGTFTADSKLLRIPFGSDTFDNFEINISKSSGFGSARGLVYAGNGKAYTAVLDESKIKSTFFTEPCYKWHELDLNAKTAKDIGLPYTAGFKGHGAVVDGGSVYFPVFNDAEIGFYNYKVADGSFAKRGNMTAGGYIQFMTKIEE